MDSREWVPDLAVENLTVRRALQNMEDPIQLSIDIIRESLPLTTMSMTHLAIHCGVETVRFQAAKYIMDKALGDNKNLTLPDARPAWDKIYETVMVEAEDALEEGE